MECMCLCVCVRACMHVYHVRMYVCVAVSDCWSKSVTLGGLGRRGRGKLSKSFLEGWVGGPLPLGEAKLKRDGWGAEKEPGVKEVAFPGLGQECSGIYLESLQTSWLWVVSFLFLFTILVCCSYSFRNYRCVYVTVWSKSSVPKRQCPKVPENRMWPQRWYLVNKWRGPSLNFQNKGLLYSSWTEGPHPLTLVCSLFFSLSKFLILFCFVFVVVFTLYNTISGHVSLLLKEKGSGFEVEEFHFWVESLASSGLTQTICTM